MGGFVGFRYVGRLSAARCESDEFGSSPSKGFCELAVGGTRGAAFVRGTMSGLGTAPRQVSGSFTRAVLAHSLPSRPSERRAAAKNPFGDVRGHRSRSRYNDPRRPARRVAIGIAALWPIATLPWTEPGDPTRPSPKRGSVDPDGAVNFYVFRARVETVSGKVPQRVGQGLITGSGQNEVDVRNSDVVRPDVNLFHGRKGTGMAYELDLRSRRRVTQPWGPLARSETYNEILLGGQRKTGWKRAKAPSFGSAGVERTQWVWLMVL